MLNFQQKIGNFGTHIYIWGGGGEGKERMFLSGLDVGISKEYEATIIDMFKEIKQIMF